MPRPTSIYWLIDVRPETIAAGWLQGLPFYAGKTDREPEKRLREHQGDDVLPSPKSLRILECGEHAGGSVRDPPAATIIGTVALAEARIR
jgi:hypothetical protein